MDTSNWRSELQADSRQRIINRIMDAMKSQIKVSGNDGLQELMKIAVSFEEKVYIAATSQSDYMRKICFKILTIETTTENPKPALLSSINGEDSQEEVYQKIKDMKDLYLPDLNRVHQKVLVKIQQRDFLPQQVNNEQLEKLKTFKIMLERFMMFLQIPKHKVLASYKDKLCKYEGIIVLIINMKPRIPVLNQ